MTSAVRLVVCLILVIVACASAEAQGLGGASTIRGVVKDPTGGVMVSVTVEIANPLSGFKRSAVTDATGAFTFSNLPANPYRVSVDAQGFKPFEQDVDVRSSVPIDLTLKLELGGTTVSVSVAGSAGLVERDPSAHTDIDQSLVAKLPLEPTSGISQAITLA